MFFTEKMGMNAFRLMGESESIPFIVAKMGELKDQMEQTIRTERRINN